MTLDINFNKELEPIINSFEPLADWFERNQDTMAYFGLTHSDCLHLEDGIAHHDLVALGRMANAALNCLEENFGIDNKAHAMAATISLMAVYAQEEDQLSEVAKEKGMKQMSDEGEIIRIANEVLDENPKAIDQYKNGRTNVVDFLTGQIMKKTRGQANPTIARSTMAKEIEKR